MSIKLKSGEFYWVNAPAVDPDKPLMIGRYEDFTSFKKWYIYGDAYTYGCGIDAVRHIPKPKVKA